MFFVRFLPIMLLNATSHANDFELKVLEYTTGFDTVGRFVVVHPHS